MIVLPVAPVIFCTVLPDGGLGLLMIVTVSAPVPGVNEVWNTLIPPAVIAPLEPVPLIALSAPSVVEPVVKSGSVTEPDPLIVMVFSAPSAEVIGANVAASSVT